MKKIYPFQFNYLLALGIYLLSVTTIFSQTLSDRYSFSIRSGTFDTLTSATRVTALEADDATTKIPIGFDFTYNDTTYWSLAVCSNGWVSFDSSNTSTTRNNIHGFANALGGGVPNMLGLLWDDLDGSAPGGISRAHYKTEGIAPNRVFTMEWKHWEWAWDCSCNAVSFQLKLYETSNVIEFIYRPEADSPSGSLSASIGIGSSVFAVGAYLSLDSVASITTVSSSNHTSTIDVVPDSGQIYRFSPSDTTPQIVDFEGYNGSNLSSVFHNWRESDGIPVPTGSISDWRSETTLGSTSAAINLFSNVHRDWIISPNVRIETADTLLFKVAVTDWLNSGTDVMGSDDTVKVMISRNDGASWASVMSFDRSSNLSNTLTTFGVPLDAYVGQSIRIGFLASDGIVSDAEDYDFHIDDILIGVTPITIEISDSNNICIGGADGVATASVSGGKRPYTYSWSNGDTTASISGLSAGTYTLTVTDSLGNTMTDSVQIEEPDTIIFEVSDSAITISSPNDSIELTARSNFFNQGNFFFTELSQFNSGTGAPLNGRPSYMTTDDYFEITGAPGADLGGITVETWRSGTSPQESFTFGRGTLLSPNGTAVIGYGTGQGDSAVHYYYTTGTSDNQNSSSSLVGYILKDATGNIMDAVATNSFTFPAEANVTASDWSGNLPGSGSTHGVRLEGPDSNNASGWIVSSNTFRQDPNVANNGVIIPILDSLEGFSWDSSGTIIGTDRKITVGPFNQSGTYVYKATLTNACGTFTDSTIITVDLVEADIVEASTCEDTARVTISGGDAPYTILWDNGDTTATADSLSPGIHYVDVTDANGRKVSDTIMVNIATVGSISEIACDSFIWAQNGMTYTMSGIYIDTTMNVAGCDSVVTLNLTINQSSTSDTNVTACDRYTWAQNGMTYTMSGTFRDTLMNAAGCDSVINLNLTINSSTVSDTNVAVCDSFTWAQNGMTYTMSGVFRDTLMNAAGCDSVISLNLTINSASSSDTNVVACDSFTWTQNGMTYTSSGTFLDTIMNVAGCDSIITLNLTINQATASDTAVTACDSYTWPLNGMTYTMSGDYLDTIANAAGCDSVITLNLSIDTLGVSVTRSGFDLITTVSGSGGGNISYQWLDCDNGDTAIVGAVSDTFNVISNGNYAVEVRQNGCIDTSNCINVLNVSLGEIQTNERLMKIYPNPVRDQLKVELEYEVEHQFIQLFDINSKLIRTVPVQSNRLSIDVAELPKGIYLLRYADAYKKFVVQ